VNPSQRPPTDPPRGDTTLKLFDETATPQEPPRTTVITAADVCREYLDDIAGELADATMREKRRVIGHFCETFGLCPWNAIELLAVKRWVKSHGKAPSYWQDVYNVVRAVFSWAVKHKVIPTNPVSGHSFPTDDTTRPMEDVELRTILRKSKPIYRRVLIFLALTGCRPIDLCRARWSDWDRADGRLLLDIHKTRRKTKAPKSVYLPTAAVKLLLWLEARKRPGQESIFVNSDGNPWKRETLSKKFRRLRIKAGVASDCVTYGLRHRLGVQSMLVGNGEMVTAEILGHDDLRSTKRYCHLAKQTAFLREAAERAASLKRHGRPPS
jgi:integrase